MELFIDLVSTVAFSLLFSFLLAKLFSTTADHQNDDFSLKSCKDVDNFEDEMKTFDRGSEKRVGLVAKIVDVDHDDELLLGDSVKSNLDNDLQVLLDEDCGSPKVNEKSRDAEIFDVTEIHIEEERDNNGDFVVCECEDNLLDESSERETSFHEVNITKSENVEVLNDKIENKVMSDEDEEEDGWEGIEKSELHKIFSAASVFVASKSNVDHLSNLGSDLKLQLSALHKVATEGPCHEPQPMALKVSARAKWNAWQELGNMSPEEAMEQYINILSRHVHGWMQDGYCEDDKQISVNAGIGPFEKLESECKSKTLLTNQQAAYDES